MRKPTFKDRLEFGLTRALEGTLAALPASVAEKAGLGIGTVIRTPLGIRRAIVDANLRRAFPDASEEWIDQTTRATFRHLGREAVEMLRLSRMDASEVIDRTVLTGFDALEDAMAEGKGSLVATGHFGNWEIGAAAAAARGITIDAVVKRQRNRLVDARLDATRRSLGVGTINMKKARTEVPRLLRAGHAIGIVFDQDAGKSGLRVPFFGHPASTHRGPALFALRVGSPIFSNTIRRREDGRYDIQIERVEYERTGDLEDDILRLTTELSLRLERAVRADPEQYFWFHKRWKTTTDEEHA